MIKISDAIFDFINDLTFVQAKSNNTIKAYKSDLNKYQAYLLANNLNYIEEIDIDLIFDFINENRQLKINSIARLSSTVKQFHRFLNFKFDLEDPSINLNVTKDKNTLPKTLSIEEIRLLMNSFSDSKVDLLNHTLLELIYACGLRASEACDLLVNKVDLNTGYLKVLGKGDKERVIPIPNNTLKLLTKYTNEFRTSYIPNNSYKYFFVNRLKKKINIEYIETTLRKQLLYLGLNDQITPHKLRHSYASHMLQNGSDLRILQELLGHSDVKTTEIYTHLSDNKIKSDYLKFHGLAKNSKKNKS